MNQQLSTLERLSSELTAEEKEELYAKIQNSISETDYILKKNDKKEKEFKEIKYKLLEKDYEEDLLFHKILMKFISFITGKNPIEVFLSGKLKNIRRSVNVKNQNLLVFERFELMPKSAHILYELYLKSFAVRNDVNKLWQSDANLNKVIDSVLTKEVEEVKNHVDDFIPINEMEKLYRFNKEKKYIISQLTIKINEYLNNIPDELFYKAEDQLIPLFYLKRITNFPFKSLFNQFGVNISSQTDNSYMFKRIPGSKILLFLEKLWLNLYPIENNIVTEADIENRIIPLLKTLEGDDDRDIHKIRVEMKQFFDNIRSLKKSFPMLEIIRYLRKDPYYSMEFSKIDIKIKDYYESHLKLRVYDQVEDTLFIVQKSLINKIRNSLFSDIVYSPMIFYCEDSKFSPQEHNLPYFTHIQSVGFLQNFIHGVFRKQYFELTQILINQILANNHVMQVKLQEIVTALLELEIEIRELDRTLSPEAESGKTFSKLKFSAVKSAAYNKMYIKFIAQRDNLFLEKIKKGLGLIESLKRNFDTITTRPMEQIKLQLSAVYKKLDSQKTIKLVVENKSSLLLDVLNLIREQLALENQEDGKS